MRQQPRNRPDNGFCEGMEAVSAAGSQQNSRSFIVIIANLILPSIYRLVQRLEAPTMMTMMIIMWVIVACEEDSGRQMEIKWNEVKP